MGYVGNQQTEGFSKIPPKQDLTGATGSTLTLSHAVSSPESIDLFINNVRQEPTESYTTDGTTVNLVGYTVAATDDIYVVYNSLAQQTSTHPSNQALQATTGTFSGAVSGTTGTFSGAVSGTTGTFSSNVDVGGSLLVDTIKDGANTNTAMTIDSTGRILTPARPAFKVTTGTTQNISSGSYAKMQWTNSVFDIGSNFDLTNNEYVVPVDGIYNILALVRGTGTQGTMDMMTVRLDIANSSGTTLYEVDLIQMHPMADQLENSHLGVSTLLDLNAGEKVSVEVRIDGFALSIGSGSAQFNWFCGYLVG